MAVTTTTKAGALLGASNSQQAWALVRNLADKFAVPQAYKKHQGVFGGVIDYDPTTSTLISQQLTERLASHVNNHTQRPLVLTYLLQDKHTNATSLATLTIHANGTIITELNDTDAKHAKDLATQLQNAMTLFAAQSSGKYRVDKHGQTKIETPLATGLEAYGVLQRFQQALHHTYHQNTITTAGSRFEDLSQLATACLLAQKPKAQFMINAAGDIYSYTTGKYPTYDAGSIVSTQQDDKGGVRCIASDGSTLSTARAIKTEGGADGAFTASFQLTELGMSSVALMLLKARCDENTTKGTTDLTITYDPFGTPQQHQLFERCLRDAGFSDAKLFDSTAEQREAKAAHQDELNTLAATHSAQLAAHVQDVDAIGTENAALQDTITNRDDTIARLKAAAGEQAHGHQEALNGLHAELAEKDRRIDTLTEINQELNALVRERHEERTVKDRLTAELTAQVTALTDDHGVAIQTLEDATEAHEEALTSLKESHATALSENKRLIIDLQKTIEGLDTNIRHLQEKRQALRETHRNALVERDVENTKLRETISIHETTLTEQGAAIERLHEQHQLAEKMFEPDLADLRTIFVGDITELEAKVNGLEAQNRALELDRMSRFSTDQLERVIADTRTQLVGAQEALDEKSRALQRATVETETLQRAATDAESRVACVSADLTELALEFATLREYYKIRDAKTSALTVENKALRKLCDTAAQELTDEEVRKAALETNLLELIQRLEKLKAAHKDTRIDLIESNASRVKGAREVTAANAKADNLSKVVAKQQADLADAERILGDQLTDHTAKRAQLIAELNRIRPAAVEASVLGDRVAQLETDLQRTHDIIDVLAPEAAKTKDSRALATVRALLLITEQRRKPLNCTVDGLTQPLGVYFVLGLKANTLLSCPRTKFLASLSTQKACELTACLQKLRRVFGEPTGITLTVSQGLLLKHYSRHQIRVACNYYKMKLQKQVTAQTLTKFPDYALIAELTLPQDDHDVRLSTNPNAWIQYLTALGIEAELEDRVAELFDVARDHYTFTDSTYYKPVSKAPVAATQAMVFQ